MRISHLIWLVGAIAQAGVKVGSFPMEEKQAFTTKEGLPSNTVNCLASVPGRMYAGTASGLVWFDRGTWHEVPQTKGKAVELCSSFLGSLTFASGAELYRLEGNSFTRLGTIPKDVPQSLVSNAAGTLVATKNQLYRWNGQFAEVALPTADLTIHQIAIGPTGSITIAADQGLFTQEPQGTWNSVHPQDGVRSWAPRNVAGVGFDPQGRLWFASRQGVGVRDQKETWRLLTGQEGLPYNDFTSLAAGENGVIWFGTHHGAIRFDGTAWEYRQGLRWLPADDVRAVALVGEQAWFATNGGVGLLSPKQMTFEKKAGVYEAEIDRYHRRTEYGYVAEVKVTQPGDSTQTVQHDSDNDGLWTSMYGAGECFAFAATKNPVAKQRARKAFEALRFLSTVTQGGEHPAPRGFPARSILPVSGRNPNDQDNHANDVRMRERDHLWKDLSPRWPKSADGKWYWKADTSSDELDGHYFFYAVYYDLAAVTDAEKEDVRAVVRAMTDHLIDHNFQLVDWDGKATRWGDFSPGSLNNTTYAWADRGLKSLSILSYLKVAEHMTGDPKYSNAYHRLVSEFGYANNAMVAKISSGPGSGNQSDDEMAFMSFYNIVKYEKNEDLRQRYAYSLAGYWSLERPEMNPFFNFVAASSLEGKTFTSAFQHAVLTPSAGWLEDAIDTLKRIPLDRFDWPQTNAQRTDIVPVRSYYADDGDLSGTGWRTNGKAIPADERFFAYWNHNPYRLNTGGRGRTLADGAVFLLPYYMGLYYGYIQ